MELIRRIGSRRVALDTAPVIYYVQGDVRYVDVLHPVFEAIDDGRLDAVTSMLTLSEALVLPVREGDADGARRFEQTILGSRIRTLPLDVAVARRVAHLRASHRTLRTPDAIQCATALEAGATAFLTNDRRLKTSLAGVPLDVLVLEDMLRI